MKFRFVDMVPAMRLWVVFVVLLGAALVWGGQAHAQSYRATLGSPEHGRSFPQGSFRGVLRIIEYPIVEIDGHRQRMVPGTRLYDTNNRIVLPAGYTGQRLNVMYIRFGNGDLHSIWLLTPQEARIRYPVENPSWWKSLQSTLGNWVDLAKWIGLSSLGL